MDERIKRQGNVCGSNRTSAKAQAEQCNKGEHLICTLHFDFLNANLVPKTSLGIVPDFLNEKFSVEKRDLGSPQYLVAAERWMKLNKRKSL
jgi:hypothetical protein